MIFSQGFEVGRALGVGISFPIWITSIYISLPPRETVWPLSAVYLLWSDAVFDTAYAV